MGIVLLCTGGAIPGSEWAGDLGESRSSHDGQITIGI